MTFTSEDVPVPVNVTMVMVISSQETVSLTPVVRLCKHYLSKIKKLVMCAIV